MEQVTKVIPQTDFKLELWFNTGDHKLFDCAPYLNKGMFASLKNIDLFMQARQSGGTVCWPNHLDLSPETLYDKSHSLT